MDLWWIAVEAVMQAEGQSFGLGFHWKQITQPRAQELVLGISSLQAGGPPLYPFRGAAKSRLRGCAPGRTNPGNP